jgi:putative ABC transport system substrate-binding protein
MTLHPIRLLMLLVLGLLVVPLSAEEPPAGRMWRIGYLSHTPPPQPAYPWTAPLEAFWQALRALGYVEGHNLAIEYRWAEGDVARLPTLAAELVQRQVDVIVTMGPPPTYAAKQATTTIPIVMSGSADPVGEGLVSSLARPGGNITGTTHTPGPDIDGKAFELFKQAVPSLSHVAVLWSDSRRWGGYVEVQQYAPSALGFALLRCPVNSLTELRGAFAAITEAHVDGLVVPSTPVTGQYQDLIMEFATTQRLPTLFRAAPPVRAGGLMSYWTDWIDLYRRTARYVDKIFKGAKPTDLPIEQPVKFELVVNVKTAEALGLTISPTLLLADEVIR